MPMELSTAGLDLIKQSEGFRAKVYQDVAGIPTIGYGHKLLNHQSFPDGIDEPFAAQGTENTAITSGVQTEFFSGPVPPPSLLARYNEIVPDGAERILAMAERQSKHRELLEAQVVAGNVESQRRGSLYAFIIVLAAIVGGIFLICMGRNVSGLSTVITSLVGPVSIFVYSQHKQSKERVEKSTALAERRRR
ncbi:MAG: DUF2335 domain-containing protein [Terracidiphilus sp.]